MSTSSSIAKKRIGFVVEQTLGHVTHAENLRTMITADGRIDPVFADIPFSAGRIAGRLPGYGNWTVRAGIRARRALRAMRRHGRLDGVFVHTQVPAVLIPDIMRRLPTVVSLDATPRQFDDLGAAYGHHRGGARTESLKWRLNFACFQRAAAIVTWSEWTKSGLVADYGVAPERISVIRPGVDLTRWARRDHQANAVDAQPPVRVLFVGGDFHRKGGAVLLTAITSLRASGVDIEVDVVTRDEVPPARAIRVHHGLHPNSPDLIALYQRADIFCLPTFADALGLVLAEAGAAGLPLVATDVGAISEIVHPELTGLLVPPGDSHALAAVLRRLAEDEQLRRRLGDAAERLANAEFDAEHNAARLVDLLIASAS